MVQYINKDALVAEIEKRIKYNHNRAYLDRSPSMVGRKEEYKDILSIIDTLEIKGVEDKFECPNTKIKDTIEVSSRMKYIDEDLKPIADFIMRYASWNLHKDEWNQPVIEVPLFRVLDALIQRGKQYCEG